MVLRTALFSYLGVVEERCYTLRKSDFFEEETTVTEQSHSTNIPILLGPSTVDLISITSTKLFPGCGCPFQHPAHSTPTHEKLSS